MYSLPIPQLPIQYYHSMDMETFHTPIKQQPLTFRDDFDDMF